MEDGEVDIDWEMNYVALGMECRAVAPTPAGPAMAGLVFCLT